METIVAVERPMTTGSRPPSIERTLCDGEMVLRVIEKGLLRWKRHEVLTDRRWFEVKGPELSHERALSPAESFLRFLGDGEPVHLIEHRGGLVRGMIDGRLISAAGGATIVTDRRILVMAVEDHRTDLVWEFSLDAIRDVEVGLAVQSVSGASRPAAFFWMTRRDELDRSAPETWNYFTIALFDDHDLSTLEPLPRMICALRTLPFTPPEKAYGPGEPYFQVGFFPKSDLVWPERCAGCGTVTDLDSKEVRATKGAFDTSVTGVSEVVFDVPVCSTCRDEWRSVRQGSFDGVVVQLAFGNRDFADEFCAINSRAELAIHPGPLMEEPRS